MDGLIYVDRLGGNSIDRAFACKMKDCSFRYPVKYTRGFEEKGEEWAPLAGLQVGKVAARKVILEKQLGEGAIQAVWKERRISSQNDGERLEEKKQTRIEGIC